MFWRAWEGYKRVDPVFSFGSNLYGLAALIGLPVSGLMAYMTAQLSWFWETFQWAGVVGIAVLTWLLIGILRQFSTNIIET